jgi:hypothetical protein
MTWYWYTVLGAYVLYALTCGCMAYVKADLCRRQAILVGLFTVLVAPAFTVYVLWPRRTS